MSRLWIERGDRGPGVRRWQELLLEAGYDLPRWGADGDFGQETETATLAAQIDLKNAGLYHGAIDCKVGDKTMGAMFKRLKRQPKNERLTVIDGVEVWDYRGYLPHPSNARPDYGNRWPKLRGVMLHRTACRMGERPARYSTMNAHIAVTLQGRIILVHPFDLHIWHGHRPSLWTIGIEADGNPLGEPPDRFWKPGGGPDPVTDAQMKAFDVLLGILIKEFTANGRTIKEVLAHRQASENRACDPGVEAWQKVGLPWMEKLGATPGSLEHGWSGETWKTGLPIPHSWDPRSSITKFWTK